MAQKLSTNDFAAIYVLMSNGNKEMQWKELRDQLGFRDHAMSNVVNRLSPRILKRREERRHRGHQTFYKINTVWLRKNRKLAQAFARIGELEMKGPDWKDRSATVLREFMAHEGFDDLMKTIDAPKFKSATRVLVMTKAFMDHMFSERLGLGLDEQQIERIMAAHYLLTWGGEDEQAGLFAEECKRRITILMDKWLQFEKNVVARFNEVAQATKVAQADATLKETHEGKTMLQELDTLSEESTWAQLIPGIRLREPNSVLPKEAGPD